MSRRSNGENLCDRCGRSVGNAGIFECVVVSDLKNNVEPIIYHFCRDREVDGKMVVGCANKVLSKRNLENYLKEVDNNGS